MDSKRSHALGKALAKHGYPLDACVEELQKANNDINKAATALIMRFGAPTGVNTVAAPTAAESASAAAAAAAAAPPPHPPSAPPSASSDAASAADAGPVAAVRGDTTWQSGGRGSVEGGSLRADVTSLLTPPRAPLVSLLPRLPRSILQAHAAAEPPGATDDVDDLEDVTVPHAASAAAAAKPAKRGGKRKAAAAAAAAAATAVPE
jgi:hypothetical protein